MKEIRNAVIRNTMLGYEDHDILTADVYLDCGCFHQGFGGFRLADKSLELFITRTLQVVGVKRWNDLIGKPCRIEADNSKIYRIGNYLKNEWFDPETEFKVLYDVSE